MSNGVIYIADGKKFNGKVKCLREATKSATSLKKYSPDVPTLIWTDEHTVDPCFDEVRSLTELNAKFKDGHWLREVRRCNKDPRLLRRAFFILCGMKLMAMSESPFDNTLYLDTDTHVVSPLESAFELECDFAIAREYPENGVENAGVVIFQGTAGKQFVRQWYEIWTESNGDRDDQEAFRKTKQSYGRNMKFLQLDWKIWNVRPKNVGNGHVPKAERAKTIIVHDRWETTPKRFFEGP